MAKHKHCEIIKAYADGYPIQVKVNSAWLDIDCPHFYDAEEYRIKPKTIKREGWAAIYHRSDGISGIHTIIYDFEDDAKQKCPNAKAVIKVEWEEEE